MSQSCPQCAAPLPEDAPGGTLCPDCEAQAVDGSAQTIRIAAPAETVMETIGDFAVLSKLGQGGMGAVYRARQISLGRLVALKVLPAQFGDDPEFISRFQREAKVAASLTHPNLVRVYSAGQVDGSHFIAMELIEGENLHERMRRERLDFTESLRICAEVARGLQFGWEKAQLVHRDIKPSNIYLSHAGEVKVGDLGLAKSVSANTTGLTQTGTMMGTPYYMSPEQIRGDKTLDFRADIYSLGCTLFEMLTGSPPYPGKDPITIAHQHINAPLPGIIKALPGCPLSLAKLVGRMLKKQVRERHTSYQDLIAEIEWVREQIEAGSVNSGATTVTPIAHRVSASPAALPKTSTPRPATAIAGTAARPNLPLYAAIAAGVVVLAVVGWLATRPAKPKPLATAAPRSSQATAKPADRPPDTTAGAPPATPRLSATASADQHSTLPLLREIKVNGGFVRDFVVLPDNKRLFVASDPFQIFDLETGAKLTQFPHPEHGAQVRGALSPDGKAYAVWAGYKDDGKPESRQDSVTTAKIVVRDVETGREIQSWSIPKPRKLASNAGVIAFSPSGQRLVARLSGGGNSVSEHVGLELGKAEPVAHWNIPDFDGQGVRALDEDRFLVTSYRKSHLLSFNAPGSVQGMGPLGWHSGTLTADRRLLIARDADDQKKVNTMAIWDLASGQKIRQFEAYPGSPSVQTLGPGQTVFFGAPAGSTKEESRVEWWDIGSGRKILVLKPTQPGDWFRSELAVSPDGRFLIVRTMNDGQPNQGDRLQVFSLTRPGASSLTNSPVASSPARFVNSLGMKFVPVPGTDVSLCIHETRRKDYSAYARAVPGVDATWQNPAIEGKPLAQDDEHPVVQVSWEDANAFCEWLSKKEGRTYRLPSEREWMLAAAFDLDDLQEANLSEKAKQQFPWGTTREEDAVRYGNYEGTGDGFAGTAPVMSFLPNRLGIYDLGGNAWEWCDGWFDAHRNSHTLRGCGFRNYGGYRKTATREPAPADFRVAPNGDYSRRVPGFRVVLAPAL